jgi:hypothetical protein
MSIPGWEELEGLIAAFGTRAQCAPANAVTVRQVHGRGVVVCDDTGPGHHGATEGDALVATRRGVVVAVKTADCVPILLSSSSPRSARRWAAAVHAGWRGAVGGVVEAAIADAESRGHAASALHAAIGPSIGPCCYEVGEDVASHFRHLDLPVIDGAKPRLDLPDIASELLRRAGLAPGNVVLCAPCTRCHPELYESYRASGPHAGRQASWIGWSS